MHNLVDPVLGLGPVVLGASLSGTVPTVGGVAASLLLFAAAVALLHALVVALTALAVLLVGADELGTVSCSVVELGVTPRVAVTWGHRLARRGPQTCSRALFGGPGRVGGTRLAVGCIRRRNGPRVHTWQ